MQASAPLVIVGGGVAGLAGAIAAAKCGLPAIVLDESSSERPRCAAWHRLRGEVLELAGKVQIIPETSVLSLSGDLEILWARHGESGVARADAIILATGGTPRPLPFPGWTLPGVITAREAIEELETDPRPPLRRAIVAGTGPRLLDTAIRLVESNVSVAIFDAAQAAEPPREITDRLRRDGVTMRYGVAIFEIQVGDASEASHLPLRVVYGSVDPVDWTPRRDRGETIEADRVIVDFGDISRDQLAVLAGARQEYDDTPRSWHPVRDRRSHTSVPGLFAASDGAGVGAFLVDEEEGRLAGIHAAEYLGVLPQDQADARRRVPLSRLVPLAARRSELEVASRIRSGLFDLVAPDTILCPCEGTALRDLRGAIAEGAREMSSMKLMTRLGMGACQGRRCGSSAAVCLARELGREVGAVGRINPRPPSAPVRLEALARMRTGLPDLDGPVGGEL